MDKLLDWIGSDVFGPPLLLAFITSAVVAAAFGDDGGNGTGVTAGKS